MLNKIIFAFDDPKDAPLIEEKLKLMPSQKLKNNKINFYVLCGYDRVGKYDAEFWERDLQSVFDRAELLKRYGCLPYVMRHENYLLSPNSQAYTQITPWANQPHMFLKKTFAEYVEYDAWYSNQRRKRHD